MGKAKMCETGCSLGLIAVPLEQVFHAAVKETYNIGGNNEWKNIEFGSKDM